MCHFVLLIPQRFWADILSDPLSFLAILLGVGGIWRSEYLFTKLDRNLNDLIDNMKKSMLREMLTVTTSYAAFTRALQAVELGPLELPKDGAFALLTSFHIQKLPFPDYSSEDLAALRTSTRENVDINARANVDLLIKSGMGKQKEGVELAEPPETK